MSANSKIEWTDHTFNPWWGCVRVSPACRFCYADRDASRYGHDLWRKNGDRRMLSDQHWRQPLRWNREAEAAGRPALVFCASMADVFEDRRDLDAPRERLWRLIGETPWLIWQLLTKRPENVVRLTPWGNDWPDHVWLGASAENQRFAEQRIPELLKVPARTHFLSCEPLLGPLNLAPWMDSLPAIDWVITGGESGAKARPSHPDWFSDVRDQCVRAGIAYHHKQNGIWAPRRYGPERDPWTDKRVRWIDQTGRTHPFGDFTGDQSWALIQRTSKEAAGRLLDGRTWDELPGGDRHG